jgi:hypothetical protein
MREHGSFPFYASWSTGLTEGAAMSVEPQYDGIYTIDQHAARILQLKYASGVREVMAFTGFASNASEKSYVLAGSFTRFLLAKYGPQRFDRVYKSLEFKEVYHKSLDSLEAEWKTWLIPLMTPLSTDDTAHFRYYYDRVAIIFNPCLRRIGKLERKAIAAYRDKRFQDAVEYYRSAVTEGAGISALLGESDAIMQRNDISGALAILDTTITPIVTRQIAALDIQKGDLRTLMDSLRASDNNYRDAMSIKLSSGTFLSAYLHRVMAESDVNKWWRGYLYESYVASPHAAELSARYLNAMLSTHSATPGFDRVQFALSYIQSLNQERKGRIAAAMAFDPFASGLPNLTDLNSDDSLAISIVALHFAAIRPGPPGESFCPLPYHEAAMEYANELRAEWQWVQLALPQPVHEKSR